MATSQSTNTTLPTAPVQTQPGSSLFKLPAEPRLTVYEYLFPLDQVVLDRFCHEKRSFSPDSKRANKAAILTTCKSICNEAEPVLYANTEFRFLLHPSREGRPCSASAALGVKLASVRRIMLDIRLVGLGLRYNRKEVSQVVEEVNNGSRLRELHIFIGRGISGLAVIADCFGDIQCKGNITAVVEDGQRFHGVDVLQSYFQMLKKIDGVDQTQQYYAARLHSLRRNAIEHAMSSRRENFARQVERMESTLAPSAANAASLSESE